MKKVMRLMWEVMWERPVGFTERHPVMIQVMILALTVFLVWKA